jgi:hypothetical protein
MILMKKGTKYPWDGGSLDSASVVYLTPGKGSGNVEKMR